VSIQIISSFFQERIIICTGDITTLEVEAIVNAANSSLMGGGGVDGAIHRVSGPELLVECKKIRETSYPHGLPTGQAVLTKAYHLPSRFIIHTVGPVYSENSRQNSSTLLKDCYANSLSIATQQGINSLAFPAISTGIYGYPKEEAAKISFKTVSEYLSLEKVPAKVYFVFFTSGDAQIFLQSIKQ
jgi:O-acetyl-ADP-ribose deacetylase (regulator of RNase III)